MKKPLVLALPLVVVLAGAIGGYFALVAPRSTSDVAAHLTWVEFKWPFAIDQWGTGRAFACTAADCGAEVRLYIRAKLVPAIARLASQMTATSIA